MANIVRRIINTKKSAQPVGPYNQAVVVDNTMYISGMLGLEPESGKMVQGGVAAEAETALENMKAVVEAAGCDMGNIVKVTILLEDINDWPKVNTIYEKYFTHHFPARAAYAVKSLPKGAKVEMEAIAAIGKITDA